MKTNDSGAGRVSASVKGKTGIQAEVAFDYAKQKWIEGAEAVAVRLAQVKEDLHVLNSPRGEAFARFSAKLSKEEAIAKAKEELARLQALTAGETANRHPLTGEPAVSVAQAFKESMARHAEQNVCADLFAALENAARQIEFTVSSMAKGHTVSISSLQNCAAQARAALAKAEGK